MVKLGLFNSRLKDFFDICLLSRQSNFDGPLLAEAMARTFANRATEITPQPIALTLTFANDPAKAAQWRGFLRKARLQHTPEDLAEVIEALTVFLTPVAQALTAGSSFEKHWVAPGPWQTRSSADDR
jgi:hypothetical protein